MCGRYGLSITNPDPQRFDLVEPFPKLPSRYNVAPSAKMPVIVNLEGNKAKIMQWGLIPAWAKDPQIASLMINARAETVAEKPSFAKPFKTSRCLIPATHFFEWKETSEGRVPYCIKLKTGDIFTFAGLYDVNEKIEGKQLLTFTIITTEPNQLVSKIHHRMPVILDQENEQAWLDQDMPADDLQKLLRPFDSDTLEAYPVSPTVNDLNNDFPGILTPMD